MPSKKGARPTKAEMLEQHRIELADMAKQARQAGRAGTYWHWNLARLRAAYKAAGWTDQELDKIEGS